MTVPADARYETVMPRYGAASLTDVLPGTLAALTGDRLPDPLGLAARLDGVRRAVVVLVDGFGYHLMAAAARAGATLADVHTGRLGQVLRLTTGFPSTTPTSLVGFGTGALPGAHGVLGFFVRVPGTDRVLNHTRWVDSPDPASWQPVPTLFTRAAAAGVATTVIADGDFAGSGLTVSAYRGADYRPGDEVDELAAGVRAALAAHHGPALVYAYHPDLDQTGHRYGIASPEWQGAAADVDRLLTMIATDLPADAALLVTADHGQLDVPPDHRFDLDRDPRLRDGVVVVAGEPRVRYLHVQPGAAAGVIETWRGILGDAAWVGTREEAVALGLFGPVPAGHLERIGDVVVACRRDYAVTAGHSRHEAELVAYHGAMTAAEMEIPLIIVRGGRPG
jgi:hypothetical protein